jgi:small subunit ribosomal protein S4e
VISAPHRGLILHPIEKDEAEYKLCRIENKTIVNGGHIQLNLHDGRNILMRVKDPTSSDEDIYKSKDALKIAVPSQEILDHIKFEENTLALVVAGRNLGLTGNVSKIEKRFGPHANLVTLEHDGKIFQTALEYAFPVGIKESMVSLPS